MNIKESAQSVYDDLFPVAEAIVRNEVEHQPALFVLTEDGGVAIVDVTGVENKSSLAKIHQKVADHELCLCAILVMEAWAVQVEKDDVEGLAKMKSLAEEGRLNESPDRTEYLTFNFLTKDDQGLAMCLITRNGGVNTLNKDDIRWKSDSEMNEMYGRFVREDKHTTH